jgi:hypothetical protein
MQEFISQLIIRLFSKTPWFWKVIQIISGVVAGILLIPKWIIAYQEGGFTIPDNWSAMLQTIVGYALIAQTLIAQLAVPTDVKKKENIQD